MNTAPELDIGKILNGFYRHKGLIIAAFLVVFSLTSFLAIRLPDVYRSSTLILITPQRLPTNYVSSTVTSTIQERINTISQQILSRTSLEKIIKEFNLYPPKGETPTMEDRIEKLRKMIKIEVQTEAASKGPGKKGRPPSSSSSSSAFLLSFDAESPVKAAQVTARLASLFIEENLRVREEQAMGTTAFINAEMERIRRELDEQEAKVNQYKAQFRFELPDQLNANLKQLEHLRAELLNSGARLSALQEKKAAIEKQLAEAATSGLDAGVGTQGGDGRQVMSRPKLIESKKLVLDTLLVQYSDKHPDIIKLRKEIDSLEKEESDEAKSGSKASSRNPVRDTLVKQATDVNFEIKSLTAKMEVIRQQAGGYNARVENTPLRSIELSKVSRNYEITLKKYNDLAVKTLDSQLSENMEKKQKGEQFQVLDPANIPQKPLSPNRIPIILLGLAGGLAAGFGLALMLEMLDTSFKGSEEMDGFANVPFLAAIPAVITRESILQRRRSQSWLVAGSVGIVAVGMLVIHVSVQVLYS